MWTLNLDNLLKSYLITLHCLDEHDPSERALFMQLVMLAHEIKNHKLNVCCKINPQTSQQLVISTFMQVQECLKCSSSCFFSKSKFILYNLTRQILTIAVKSYTYMSQVWANLMITWIASNNGLSQLNPSPFQCHKGTKGLFLLLPQ